METERRSFIKWVKSHKRELIIAGISVATVLWIVISLKNKDAVLVFGNALKDNITKAPEKMPESMNAAQVQFPALEKVISARSYTSPQEAFDVSQHIRNLSGGRHHSAEKAAEAKKLGIFLSPNQTIVDTYRKCAA